MSEKYDNEYVKIYVSKRVRKILNMKKAEGEYRSVGNLIEDLVDKYLEEEKEKKEKG